MDLPLDDEKVQAKEFAVTGFDRATVYRRVSGLRMPSNGRTIMMCCCGTFSALSRRGGM